MNRLMNAFCKKEKRRKRQLELASQWEVRHSRQGRKKDQRRRKNRGTGTRNNELREEGWRLKWQLTQEHNSRATFELPIPISEGEAPDHVLRRRVSHEAVLRPILFNISLLSIASCVRETVHISFYANDISISASSRSLEQFLSKLWKAANSFYDTIVPTA